MFCHRSVQIVVLTVLGIVFGTYFRPKILSNKVNKSPLSSYTITNNKVLGSSTNVINTLLIDNYDSYTYNLWQLLADINKKEPTVIFNNRFKDLSHALENLNEEFDNIVLSPGPGTPLKVEDFGISKDTILNCNIPLLGVCLGHQGIAHAYDGNVIRSPEPMHGRLSSVNHCSTDIFDGIPNNFNVVRYHSLITETPLPEDLVKTAWTNDDIVMGLRHKFKPIYGVQFHPESICTEYGGKILENFRDVTVDYHAKNPLIKRYNFNAKQKKTLFSTSSNKLSDEDFKLLDLLSPNNNHDEQSTKDLQSVQSRRHIHVIKTKIDESVVSIEDIFSELFTDASASFWLDSSSMTSYNQNNISFSFLGALDSDTAYSIEYLGNNKLITRQGWSSQSKNNTITSTFEQNIFEYLQDKILNESNICTNFTFQVVSNLHDEIADQRINTMDSGLHLNIGLNGNSLPNQKDSNVVRFVSQLPFNLTEILFGYISYEARNTATHILASPRISTAKLDKEEYEKENERPSMSLFNLSATKDKLFSENKYLSSLTHPLALFMVPSRYIMYNHMTNDLYIIATEVDASTTIYSNDIDRTNDKHSTNCIYHGEELFSRLQSAINKFTFSKNTNNSVNHTPSATSSDDTGSLHQAENAMNNNGMLNQDIWNKTISNTIGMGSHVLLGDKSREKYKDNISKCIEYIKMGETYEVCLTMQFNGSISQDSSGQLLHQGKDNKDKIADKFKSNAFKKYQKLRKGNSAPYSTYLYYDPMQRYLEYNKDMEMMQLLKELNLEWTKGNLDGFAVLCSSPERFIKASEVSVTVLNYT